MGLFTHRGAFTVGVRKHGDVSSRRKLHPCVQAKPVVQGAGAFGALGDQGGAVDTLVLSGEQAHRSVDVDGGGGVDSPGLFHCESDQGDVALLHRELTKVGHAPARLDFHQQACKWVSIPIGFLQIQLVACGGKNDLALEANTNRPCVDHFGGGEDDTAIGFGRDRCPFCDLHGDGHRVALGIESVVRAGTLKRSALVVVEHLGDAAQESLLSDLQRTGNQAMHVHDRLSPKQKPVAVVQVNLPIGGQLPQDHARIGVVDQVQGNGGAAGLGEVHRVSTADVEVIPGENDPVVLLLNSQAVLVVVGSGGAELIHRAGALLLQQRPHLGGGGKFSQDRPGHHQAAAEQPAPMSASRRSGGRESHVTTSTPG